MTKLRILRGAAVALVALGALGFLLKGANRPADPSLKASPQGVTLNRTPFGDFGEIGFRIDGATPAQAAAVRCALLADTEARQELGLMNRTDVGGYDGMLFEFPADTNVSFYMKDTPLPLSIAFFDSAGLFVSTLDMAPCIHQTTCKLYDATRPYRYALEVPQGALPRLGIASGTRLVTTGPCP